MGGSSAPPPLSRPLIMLQKIRSQPTHPAGAIDSSDHVGRLVGKTQPPNLAQFTQRVPLALLTMSGVWRYFRTPRHRSVHPAGATGASDRVGHLETLPQAVTSNATRNWRCLGTPNRTPFHPSTSVHQGTKHQKCDGTLRAH